ncbi:universal stress protein [Sediminibacterium ginsengisoli]|uniref:Nucleotide-binding universal stress protein, UspA family n=1 Tax=Sediminibacterium ginsengisoli TaxID=413434 RepID=A0A1T4NIN6_9BACT|nr:universal stress protein [Sediminibacterium ginsengisoli]SJZ78897.1 Nucleotide-binding universal stress protein, UspA family [Sediminibacterium ginsengisoli]
MNTILVPTDFSPTAKNAAVYAMQLAADLGVGKIIFYHSYQAPVSIDPVVPAVQLFDIDSLKEASEEGLRHFMNEMAAAAPGNGIVFDSISEYNMLTDGINDAVERTGAGWVVMGITGGGALEETLIGSNAVNVAKQTPVPVIIVPAGAAYKKITRILLACDFKKVLDTMPVQPIRNLLNDTGAKLMVLHIDSAHRDYNSELAGEIQVLDALLKDYYPEYHFIDHDDFTEGMNAFALEHQADIIITIPKKHGWFEGLFRRSHTRKLAFHTSIPLMVIHE